MIKKSAVILLLFILFSIVAVPQEVKAESIGEVALIGTAIVVVIGLISILVSSSTEGSLTLDVSEQNELYAESNVIHFANANYGIAAYPTKTGPLESPYALTIRF
jgi:hypothetical protein